MTEASKSAHGEPPSGGTSSVLRDISRENAKWLRRIAALQVLSTAAAAALSVGLLCMPLWGLRIAGVLGLFVVVAALREQGILRECIRNLTRFADTGDSSALESALESQGRYYRVQVLYGAVWWPAALLVIVVGIALVNLAVHLAGYKHP